MGKYRFNGGGGATFAESLWLWLGVPPQSTARGSDGPSFDPSHRYVTSTLPFLGPLAVASIRAFIAVYAFIALIYDAVTTGSLFLSYLWVTLHSRMVQPAMLLTVHTAPTAPF